MINLSEIFKLPAAPETEEDKVSYNDLKFFQETLSLMRPLNSIEIGCANGISSVLITKYTRGTSVIIDPYQSYGYESNGLKHIKKYNEGILLKETDKAEIFRSEVEKEIHFYEVKSESILPRLLDDNFKCDFIFIDGDHRFDAQFIDFFYGSKLLEVGGLISLHDVKDPATIKLRSFIDTNMLNLKIIALSDTMITYKKESEDLRDYDFHKNF